MSSFFRLEESSDSDADDYVPIGDKIDRVAFEPSRIASSALFNDLPVQSTIDGEPCTVIEINYTTIKFTSRIEIQPHERRSLRIKALDIKNTPILLDETCIITEVDGGYNPTYLATFKSPVDIETIKAQARRLYTRWILSRPLDAISDALPDGYEVLASRLQIHIASLKRKADTIENAIGRLSTESRMDIAVRLLSEHGPAFREICFDLNDLIQNRSYGSPEMIAIKRHAEEILTPYFMGAPVCWQAYTKPFGYPGDYQVMLYSYHSSKPVEDARTLFDCVLHLYFAHSFGDCIRGRMNIAVDAITEAIQAAQTSNDDRFTITNVGCGAAVELPIIIDFAEQDEKHLTIHLVEQDSRPLQVAFQQVAARKPARSSASNVRAFNVSFKELYRAGRLTTEEGLVEQDVVYSLGLVDYFSHMQARRFTREMYSNVKPGGLLILGNMAQTRERSEFISEVLADWRMFYRDENQMRDMFADCEGAELILKIEPTRQMWVGIARKPS